MEFGICLLSMIPVRAEPSHKSEMVTQVLFGEQYQIIEKEISWCKIKIEFDGYEGWIDLQMAYLIDEIEFTRLAGSAIYTTLELVQLLSHSERKSLIPIVIGSSLPGLNETQISLGREVFLYEGLVTAFCIEGATINPRNTMKIRQQLIEDAKLYLNAPYLWGGRTPFGIDCSGFVQMIYKLQGIRLFRDASQQAAQGEVISLLAESEPGDLAFFDNEEGLITHVGMIIDHSLIIHCSGKVRIDALDHEGIFHANLQKYTHKLRLIKE